MSNKKGFTLIELVITMVLLAIVATISFPIFQRFAINNNLKTAARDIASDIGLFKERAIAENRMFRITLNTGGNSYTLQQCNGVGSPCGGWTSIQVKNLMGYAADINFDPGATTETDYFFQPRGMVTTGTIVLTNGRGSTGTLTINVTGRQNVQFNLQ